MNATIENQIQTETPTATANSNPVAIFIESLASVSDLLQLPTPVPSLGDIRRLLDKRIGELETHFSQRDPRDPTYADAQKTYSANRTLLFRKIQELNDAYRKAVSLRLPTEPAQLQPLAPSPKVSKIDISTPKCENAPKSPETARTEPAPEPHNPRTPAAQPPHQPRTSAAPHPHTSAQTKKTGRRELDELTPDEEAFILMHIDANWSDSKIAEELAKPVPHGLSIDTTRFSVRRFRLRHESLRAEQLLESIERSLSESRALTIAGNLAEATAKLLQARIYEASTKPKLDNKELALLTRALKAVQQNPKSK